MHFTYGSCPFNKVYRYHKSSGHYRRVGTFLQNITLRTKNPDTAALIQKQHKTYLISPTTISLNPESTRVDGITWNMAVLLATLATQKVKAFYSSKTEINKPLKSCMYTLTKKLPVPLYRNRSVPFLSHNRFNWEFLCWQKRVDFNLNRATFSGPQ